MKTLGIIGGIAPESTIAYYRSIISFYRQRKTDGSYPSVIINSIDLKKMLDLIGANELARVTDYLLEELRRLERAGADCGLLASNTPHIVFHELQRQSTIPLISIVAAACDVAESLKLKRVGLFGTRFTMQGGFYQEAFSKRGIAVILPSSEAQNYIHNHYMSELVNGFYLEETRAGLLQIVDEMLERSGIQGLILGGTELPLLLQSSSHRSIPFLDTTRMHAERAVFEMLE